MTEEKNKELLDPTRPNPDNIPQIEQPVVDPTEKIPPEDLEEIEQPQLNKMIRVQKDGSAVAVVKVDAEYNFKEVEQKLIEAGFTDGHSAAYKDGQFKLKVALKNKNQNVKKLKKLFDDYSPSETEDERSKKEIAKVRKKDLQKKFLKALDDDDFLNEVRTKLGI